MSGGSGNGALKEAASQGSLDEGLGRDVSTLSLCASTDSPDETFQECGHAILALKNMHGYLQSKLLCDVVLVAGFTRIPAHKLVLSASSEYFAAMFTGSLRESQLNEITLENIDPQALQSLVHYCYSGSIELREDTVETLLSTASLLRLEPVVEVCCGYLRSQLDPCNCLGIALFAEQQSCEQLYKHAVDYTHQHFMEVVKNQEFLALRPEQLSRILVSEELNVQLEEDVFESLMLWVRHDAASREAHLPSLLKLIKLPLMSSEYLIDKVETACGYVRECQPLIMEAVKWHLLPARRPALSSGRTRPRTSTMGRLLVVGGVDGCKGSSSMEVYDPRADTWTPFIQMGIRRLQFGVALVHNKLVIVGGRDGLKTLNTVECFDLSTRNWSTLAPLNTHRHGLGVAVLGEGPTAPVYAVGGHDGWIYLNSVERWDACARSWSLVAPLQGARSTCGAAAAGGKLYAVGGRDGGSCLRSVECYDPATDRWTSCAPMIRRRGGVSVCSAGGMIYALGGHEAPASASGGRLACMERYDPARDQWVMLAQLSCARDAVSTCLLADRIVCVGGFDGTRYLNTVQMYDPATDTWKFLAPMSSGRAGAALLLVPTPKRTDKHKQTDKHLLT